MYKLLNLPEVQYILHLAKENNQIAKSLVDFVNDRDTKICLILDSKLESKVKYLGLKINTLSKLLESTIFEFENYNDNIEFKSKIYDCLNKSIEISQLIKLKFENIKEYKYESKV